MDATFWAFVALILFFAVITYLKVPGKIGAAIDSRGEAIRKDLDEARRLREEAQVLLADYQRKRREAEAEAQAIVAEAKLEAERLTNEATVALEDMVRRRTKAAEAKIAQAETQAIAEVRAKAASVAIAAAERVLVDKVKGSVAEKILAQSIDSVKARLN